MKMYRILAAAAILMGGTSSTAFALLITPTTGILGTTRWETNTTSNLSDAALAAIVGGTTFPVLYKQDVGAGSDTGTFAASYRTSFANSVSDPMDATITYVAGQSYMTCSVCYLIVKDGNQSPAQYIYRLSATSPIMWNGTETLEIRGFWPNQGAISHVEIRGAATRTPPGDPSIPEPTTLALLGLGLLGAGVARRRKQ